jgi:hypothetical protein
MHFVLLLGHIWDARKTLNFSFAVNAAQSHKGSVINVGPT